MDKVTPPENDRTSIKSGQRSPTGKRAAFSSKAPIPRLRRKTDSYKGPLRRRKDFLNIHPFAV